MALAGIIIGVISLLVSSVVAWRNYLSPFRTKIFCGNPRLEPIPFDLGNGQKVIRFNVILPLFFVNTGANGGIVNDLALIVHSARNTWVFRPWFYTRYGIQTESTLGKNLTEDPSNEPFYPIHLLAKEKLYKSVAFVSLPEDRFSLGDNPLSSGEYVFELRTLEAGQENYELKLDFRIRLTEEDVKESSSASSPKYLIPFTEEIKEKRKKVLG